MDVSSFIRDHSQNKRIDRNYKRINSVEGDTEDLKERVDRLETENADIRAVCLSLFRVLAEREILTEEAFIQSWRAAQSSSSEDWLRLYLQVNPPRPPIPRRKRRSVDFTDAAKAAEEMTQYVPPSVEETVC